MAPAVALAAAGAVGVSGCGSSDQATARPGTSPAVATGVSGVGTGTGSSAAAGSSAAPARGPAPGAVAVRYTEALFAGRFAEAEADVAPGSKNALKVVELGLRSSSVHAKGLKAGTTRVSGDQAAVVLTGTLCSSHTDARAASKRGEDCVTNRDAHASNPIFGVALQRAASGDWQVVYRLPGQAPAG